MAIKMTEREARAFYAQIGRPYPSDPDPRAARVGLAAVEAALSTTPSLNPLSLHYDPVACAAQDAEKLHRARIRVWGVQAVQMALEGEL